MPIYEYVCTRCKKIQDKLVKISEAENQTCDCEDGAKLERTNSIHATSFILKGSGWYNGRGR